MSKDYYKILGIEKGASADEVKAAFRRMAHQHHPDKKGGDEKKFKEANEAFQVLSDSKKREQYDQYGTTFDNAGPGGPGGFDFSGFQQGGGAPGFDFGDLGDIFSNMGGFGDMFSGGRRGGRRAKRGRDIQVDVELDLKDAAFGVEKSVRLYKQSACDVCSGSGVEPGSKKVSCKECDGHGQTAQTQRTPFGVFQTAVACTKCSGEGQMAEKECKHCRGEGVEKREQEIKIKIPAGIDNGESIRLTGYGEAAKKGGQPGDLYVLVHVKKDPRFRRKDFDLYVKKNISFSQAGLGDTIEIETLDGPAKVVAPEGIQSGQMIRLKGKGMGILNDSGRGDLYVEIIVETPRKLSKRQKELLKELSQEEI